MNFHFLDFYVQVLSLWTGVVICWEELCPDELFEAVRRSRLSCGRHDDCCQLGQIVYAGNEIWKGLCVGSELFLLPVVERNEEKTSTCARIIRNGCFLLESCEKILEKEENCLRRGRKRRKECGKIYSGDDEDANGKNREIGDGGNEKGIDSASGTENAISERHRPDSSVSREITKEVDFPQDLLDDEENWKNRSTTSYPPSPSSPPPLIPSSTKSFRKVHHSMDESSKRAGKQTESKFSDIKQPTDGYGIIPFRPDNNHDYREKALSLTSSSPCRFYESFFNDYCYFLRVFKYTKTEGNLSTQSIFSKNRGFLYGLSANSTKSCSLYQSGALGLAVETKKENRFVMDYIKSQNLSHGTLILTSGIVQKGAPGQWKDWNLEVDHSVINCTPIATSEVMLYAINSSTLSWQLLNLTTFLSSNAKNEWFVMCKRSHNFRNIQTDLYQRCVKEYRASECYNSFKFVDYCCAVDEKGTLWFGCPNEIQVKETSSGQECAWYCGEDGLFVQEYPICRKETSCKAVHMNRQYVAASGRHAIGSCPIGLYGYSTWFCTYNSTFLGSPKFVCCLNNVMCKAIDLYLNIWMACPGQRVSKRVICPPESLLATATADWYCTNDVRFSGTSPDYSKCNKTEVLCLKKDKYGREWTAAGGTIVRKICPHSTTEKCFWKCNKNGEFDTSEPDCSKCRVHWTNNITEHIKNETHYTVVMEMIENHTRTEDLTLGFSQVLSLTSDFVDLFEKQDSENRTQFNNFLVGYTKILKNVAGKPKIWSTFLVSSRREYAKKILKTTQKAAFSHLSSTSLYTFNFSYNATLADFERDGFDFFVLYGSAPSGTRFPLENFDKRNWGLEINEVNGTGSSFATMGLIMNVSLSHLMFPTGNETVNLKMNSPAVTFTVATLKGNETTLIPNVSVSVTFKHANKTRLPASNIIRRRLHEGEIPSGVFGSTNCYYFSQSDWKSDGCSVTSVTSDETQCTCTHLSTIGLLMSVHHYEPDTVLETISIASSVITIVALILTLIVFLSFDTIKNERILIGVNLCVCLIFGHFLLITVMDKRFFYIPDDMCPVYARLIHYVFMAAFAWMFLEGCHLYRMLVLVFESDIEYQSIYTIVGYGMPGLVVGLTELIGFGYHERPYGEDELCWLKTPNYVWAFIGPVILLTLINFIILIKAMKLAIASKVKMEKSNLYNLKVWIKGCFSLSALLGITWLFGLAYVHYNQFLAYTFVILNGLQGFFIFLFRVVCNNQYKAAFLRKFKSLFAIKDDFGSFKKPDNVRSGTKLFMVTPTATKTSGSEVDSGLVLSRRGTHRSTILLKFLKLSFFKSKERNSGGVKGEEDEISSGIGLEFEEGGSSRRGTLRNRFSRGEEKTDSDCVDAAEVNKPNSWTDPDDFPELSYHTNHYRI